MRNAPDAPALNPVPARELFLRMLGGSGMYAIALLGQRLASLVLLPINTRYLEPQDYAVLELVEQIGSVLALVLGLNFSAALGYFYFRSPDERGRKEAAATTLIGSVAAGSLAALLCVPASAWICQLAFNSTVQTGYLQVSFLIMPLAFLIEAGYTLFRIEDRARSYVALSMLRIGLTIAATIVFLPVLDLRVWGVLLSSVTAITGVAIAMYVMHRRSFVFGLFSRELFGQMLRYSIPLGIGSIAMFIIHFGDRFILPRYRPLSDLGLYALAYKVAMLLSFLSGSFQTYWSAQIFVIVARPDSRSMVARTFTYLTLVLVYTAVALALLCKPAMGLLIAPKFHPAAALVPVLLLAYLTRSLGDFYRPLFLAAGRPAADGICNWVGALSCLGGYFLLIPPYGVEGAAWATVLAFAASSLVAALWSRRYWPWTVEWARLGKIMVAAGLVYGAYLGLFVRVQELSQVHIYGALAAVALLTAFPVLLWGFGFFSTEERLMLAGGWNKLMRRSG